MRRTTTAMLIGAALLLSGSARADDLVRLKDGSLYRGKMIEKVENDHVTIKLATGAIKTLPWPELAGEPTFVSDDEDTFQPAQAPPVHVRVEADKRDATLFRFAMTGASNPQASVYFANDVPVCTAPCTAEVSRVDLLRVGGDGITPTARFALPPGTDEIRVNAGSSALRSVGYGLLAVGILNIGPGAIFTGMGRIGGDNRCTIDLGGGGQSCAVEGGTNLRPLGLGMLIGGGVAVVTGIVLASVNRTSVTTAQGQSLAESTVPLGHGLSLSSKGLVF